MAKYTVRSAFVSMVLGDYLSPCHLCILRVDELSATACNSWPCTCLRTLVKDELEDVSVMGEGNHHQLFLHDIKGGALSSFLVARNALLVVFPKNQAPLDTLQRL